MEALTRISGTEPANNRHGLLPASASGPCDCCAAEKSYEIAAPHSIAASAK
jgi:hypothetical protein